jgi:very-short-patch-repair endonuclease
MASQAPALGRGWGGEREISNDLCGGVECGQGDATAPQSAGWPAVPGMRISIMATPRAFARTLRRSKTVAEDAFWALVRGRRFHGHKFRRQVPIDRYVVDFLCMDARIIVEIDGRQHAGEADHDTARTAILQGLGFEVVRFTNDDVLLRPAVTEARLKVILDSRVVD